MKFMLRQIKMKVKMNKVKTRVEISPKECLDNKDGLILEKDKT